MCKTWNYTCASTTLKAKGRKLQENRNNYNDSNKMLWKIWTKLALNKETKNVKT